MKISEIGEFGLIDLLNKELGKQGSNVIKGIGDDAAVISSVKNELLLMTTDMLVEGIHFSFDFAAPEDVGHKAMEVNVSDIAAMGGEPAQAVISIGIPQNITVEKVREIYKGIIKSAKFHGLDIVGGDTVKNPERLIINVALTGWVEKDKVLYRSGAKAGDIVMITGTVGDSAAGLHLLLNTGVKFDEKLSRYLKEKHLKPLARVKEAGILAALGAVTSMNDISDGLSSEINEICRASDAGCKIFAEKIPISKAAKRLAEKVKVDPLDWALHGGEDFQLVFTVSKEKAEVVTETMEKAGHPVYIIGEITSAEEGMWLIFQDGEIAPLKAKGYNHFSR